VLLVGQSRDRFPVVSLGIFSVVRPTEPCALRSTQPLKVSTRDSSWGKGGRCVWLTTYHPCSAETSRKSGALIYLEPLGPPRPVAGNLYFTFLPTNIHWSGIGCVIDGGPAETVYSHHEITALYGLPKGISLLQPCHRTYISEPLFIFISV